MIRRVKLTGWHAIQAKQYNDKVVLRKYNDDGEPAREEITVCDAIEIAKEDPTLIYGYVSWLGQSVKN
ncbi:MAG: hypothetical protein MN733_27860 [Nitrososphaera sp.]|nr:hypothetical protein [Nitrososphaera sp.]